MGLHRIAGVCFLFFLHISVSLSLPQSILQYHSKSKTFGSLSGDDEFSVDLKNVRSIYQFCDSWRYSVEVNNVGNWSQIPWICFGFVKKYMTGPRYWSDCYAANYYGLEFAKSVNISGDGKDAWVFDVDETLLSNVDHFLGHGTKRNGKLTYVDWYSPAIPSSLKLFNELKKLKFKIFILTGRDEQLDRAITISNLECVGYKNWDRLILRGPEDRGTLASVYKSKKRKELEDEGYRIQGNSGDQWSDLIGYSVAERSFKMPNPLYYAA